MVDFAEAIEDCRVLDPGFDGSSFTWAKNGLFERLDRILVNEPWAQLFEATRVTNVPRVSLDHGPVLARYGCYTGAEGLLNLQIKLARIKKTFKEWNKAVFGNIHDNLRALEEKIVAAQAGFEERPSLENRAEVNRSIAMYIRLLKMEEDFWRQKATLRWLAEGDKNTKFYQSWVKQKRLRMRIHKINVGGRELSDDLEIRNLAVEFFQNLLAPGPLTLSEPDLSLIQRLPPSPEAMPYRIHQMPRK
ncbi:uncharacterized protein LOC121766894 [Salvia splendens]|uniref:uncharacterized protein LOC121766894 n=1 Tax=Salvia splendens TaxID=180675 RepID=UPI001C25F619|nr:uncharacterized protein LOC121766894 [Salvia splendens]